MKKKILVLFTSANPLTNAHINIMKTAVGHLGAEKGLFVATNGQYLRRKTVKINDPFYLTEDERRYIIEKACESEPGLDFWGYEMGGINPRRYQTLYKIRDRYPDYDIYELQGADKILSLVRFKNYEDHVSNLHFAVVGRNDIDAEKFISDDPVLSRYSDHFVLMPPLDDGAAISSTEVRRRFYAGRDYTDLVPDAAAEILGKHKPSDFTLTYGDVMKTLMRSGRSGAYRANKKSLHREHRTVQ